MSDERWYYRVFRRDGLRIITMHDGNAHTYTHLNYATGEIFPTLESAMEWVRDAEHEAMRPLRDLNAQYLQWLATEARKLVDKPRRG